MPSDLPQFISSNPRFALGFSGGTDSTFLLHEAVRLGADVLPVFARTPFVTSSEAQWASDLCAGLGVELVVLEPDIMSLPGIVSNGPDRCYHCKRAIFSSIVESAGELGYDMVCDGTNASDPESDRPGMRAVRELGVRSPLRECGLTKDDVRRLSRDAGLPTWNMPSNSCLATRVGTGVPITTDILHRVDGAETALRLMGYSDLRVRTDGTSARIQFTRAQRANALADPGVARAVEPYFNDFAIDDTTRD